MLKGLFQGIFRDKNMKLIFQSATLLILLSFSHLSAQEIISIREARTMQVGTEVTVHGVINCPDYGFNNGQFYIQDATAGINIFYNSIGGENGAPTDYDEGDSIQVRGRIEIFSELLEILPLEINILTKGETLPDPIRISPSDLNVDSDFQGMRVELVDVTIPDATNWPTEPQDESSGINVEVMAGDSLFVMRIDRGQSAFDGTPVPEQPFVLRGILTRFFENVQILPFFAEDIVPGTSTGIFSFPDNHTDLTVYPNPVSDQAITIDRSALPGKLINIRLYDVRGSEIAEVVPTGVTGQTLQLTLPAGLKRGNFFLLVRTSESVGVARLTRL